MGSQYTALYDACVLYPAPLRDLLMQLALTDLFWARWSDQIHDEWIRNVLRNQPNLSAEQLERTRRLMNSHVRDCLVTGYESLIPELALPDPDDRHVLAAAIRGGADGIVTFNLKDFPQDRLAPYGIQAQHPDDFIADVIDLHPLKVAAAAETVRQRLKRYPKSRDEYLDILLKQQLPLTVSLLRELWRAM